MKSFIAVLLVVVIMLLGVVAHMQSRISKLETCFTEHEMAPAVLSDATEIEIPNWRHSEIPDPDGYGSDEPSYVRMTIGELRQEIADNQWEVYEMLNGITPIPHMPEQTKGQEKFKREGASSTLPNSGPPGTELEFVLVTPHVDRDK